MLSNSTIDDKTPAASTQEQTKMTLIMHRRDAPMSDTMKPLLMTPAAKAKCVLKIAPPSASFDFVVSPLGLTMFAEPWSPDDSEVLPASRHHSPHRNTPLLVRRSRRSWRRR